MGTGFLRMKYWNRGIGLRYCSLNPRNKGVTSRLVAACDTKEGVLKRQDRFFKV